VSGIILDNIARGRRKHVWVSTSSDLLNDAARDVADLGMYVRIIDGPQECAALFEASDCSPH
jgi:hypothetical protein